MATHFVVSGLHLYEIWSYKKPCFYKIRFQANSSYYCISAVGKCMQVMPLIHFAIS